MESASHIDHLALSAYLTTLFGRARPELLAEVRFRTRAGMARRFHRVVCLDELAHEAARLGATTDVYVGALPRWRRGGGRADIAGSCRVVWVDCDGEHAARALERLEPAPSMVVASGTEGHRHAYWLLRRTVPPPVIERANRRLAWALRADLGSTDPAPPGTLNHKHSPPTPVRLIHLDPDAHVGVDELVRGLPDPPPEVARRHPARPRRPARRRRDKLLSVPPAAYIERLTGERVPRSRKLPCPFHHDAEPSLHVYPEPERGWFCFGCRRGGSVYDLAALLWRRTPRGRDFLALRRDLRSLLA